MIIRPLVAAALMLGGQLLAKTVEVEDFAFQKSAGGISEYVYEPNGLSVLLMPDHSAPVVTFMVTYRVGSRNEVTGTTGATHLLEHLMFKGTESYNRAKGNSVDQFLRRVGSRFNATTWLDRTNYYATLGSEHLETYMAIEADRMRNLLVREEDRRPEMTVVRNEFEIGENDPTQALDKEISALSYLAHPYHHSTIGWRSDIENVSIEKLREFYNTFYWPDNATVTVIGDFEPANVMGLIAKYYGVYPRAPEPIPTVYTVEPPQSGERRTIVRRAGEYGVVGMTHKTPEATHADHAAIKVLGAILDNGKNSRLYRALIDKNLTTSADVFTGAFHDPSGQFIYANLAPGIEHQEVEDAILDALTKLKSDGVSEAEVTAAINQLTAAAAFGRDGSFAIASRINESIAAGDWTLYVTGDDSLRAITAADVKRVANLYLNENQRTVGWFVPLETEAAE